MHHYLIRAKFFLATFIFFLATFFVVTTLAQASSKSNNAQAPVLTDAAAFLQTEPIGVLIDDVPAQESSLTPAPIVPDQATIGKPVRLSIPAIGVNAAIEHIGLTGAGAVGVPDNAVDVSWFDAGPRPGQLGSAVIVGHYGIWKNGSHSVFDRLPDLKIGDHITVKDDQGTIRLFVVQESKVYSKDATVPEIFKKSDQAYLNIITCHGQYLPSQKTYSQRLVVFAKLQ